MAANEDLSLPKATISKLIKELLPNDIKCANDTRDMLLECCVEFIHLLSSEANEACSKDKKKTISPEHILTSLHALGFEVYHDKVKAVLDEHKEIVQEKSKGTKKLKNQDIPEEELLLQQQELFAKARTALRNSQILAQSTEGLPNDADSSPMDTTPSIPNIVLSSYDMNQEEELDNDEEIEEFD